MIKNTKKDSEMKHVKYIKIFLKKKKSKSQKMHEKDIKILLKRKKKRCQHYQERKQKLPEYRRNYYLTHERLTIESFNEILLVLEQFNFFWA